ncbi:MAG: hypothetical protein Q9M31_10410 [Mariprofundus sp.]|nr:hypothetical protein [Mariprofundus sp.]
MKEYFLLIYIVFISFGFVTSAYASKTIQKRACISFSKSMTDINLQKKELLLTAKRAAANELFGELITSSSSVADYQLTSDLVTASSAGMIRVYGSPKYENGKGLGEICVSIHAYATASDMKKFKPVPISNKQCVSDATLTVIAIQKHAKEQAVLSAIDNYNHNLNDYKKDARLSLAHNITFTQAGFIPDTATYCAKFEGTLFPIEVIALLAKKTNGKSLISPKHAGAKRITKAHAKKPAAKKTIRKKRLKAKNRAKRNNRVVLPTEFFIAQSTPSAKGSESASEVKRCRLNVYFPKYLYKYSRKKTMLTEVLPRHGNFIYLAFMQAVKKPGIGYQVQVKGSMYAGKRVLGSFVATRNTRGNIFKSQCRNLLGLTKRIAKDVAGWSKHPSINAQL